MSNDNGTRNKAFGDLLAEVDAICASSERQRRVHMPEYERRRGLVIRRQAEILVELIDQRIELQRVLKRSFGSRLLGKVHGYFLKFIERLWPADADHSEHRNLKDAQESDLALQLAEAIFLHSFVDLNVHGFGFRKIAFEEMEDRIPVSLAPHRLSETSE